MQIGAHNKDFLPLGLRKDLSFKICVASAHKLIKLRAA